MHGWVNEKYRLIATYYLATWPALFLLHHSILYYLSYEI